MYSIIRCIGPGAWDCIIRLMKSDHYGIFSIRKIGDDDFIIWFSASHNDFDVTNEFLLNKLKEMAQGQVYDNPHTIKKFPRCISVTINCPKYISRY